MNLPPRLLIAAVLLGATATWAAPPATGTVRVDAVFAHPATATDIARLLGAATRDLATAQSLRGAYTQRKTLRGVPRPLVADGTFLFVRDHGIAWRTEQPFESELVITATDIVQREGGRVSMRLSAAQQPAVRVIASLFAAVFALDFDALAERFDLYCRKAGAGWELGLRPRVASGALKEIVVAGGAHVERVLVVDTNGDRTEIRLRDTVVAAAAPPADELRRFAP